MSTRLILIRHGNTFGPGDKVVWCGARTDLPLVESGRAQAEALGRHFAEIGQSCDAVIAGPLLRTRQHARIIKDKIGYARNIRIDERLREINYGPWEALSTQEIIALGGAAELDAWDKHAKWPQSPGWYPEEAQIKQDITQFLEESVAQYEGKTLFIVSSNGLMRFFARLAENPRAASDLKVRTGHYCQMSWQDGAWHIDDWNRAPV